MLELAMKREGFTHLGNWFYKNSSKPLIIRGARQVGKTTLVELFCEQNKIELFSFNLEITRFDSLEEKNFELSLLIDEIQFKLRKTLTSNTLIFFDEIQESPRLLKLLRYFYEERPDLKVIAAGSLLEIALKSEEFSFPVGRVEFYHLGPLNFSEFLIATGQDYLNEKLKKLELNEIVHKQALEAFSNFVIVGGMPAAVKLYIETNSLYEVTQLQSQLLQTYRADFPKYNSRINSNRINRIFEKIGYEIGKKIIFSHIDTESQAREIKRILELLFDSRLISKCVHTDGHRGLNAHSDDRIFKTYYLDIGLLNSSLKVDIHNIKDEFSMNFKSKGILAEQFVAQHLNYFYGPSVEPILFYYLKDKEIKKAEVDFLVEVNNEVIPIEVKSSASGHLKSLKQFARKFNSKIAIKASLDHFSIENFDEETKLINCPLYLIPFLDKVIEKTL